MSDPKKQGRPPNSWLRAAVDFLVRDPWRAFLLCSFLTLGGSKFQVARPDFCTIPVHLVYTVRQGDSCTDIAERLSGLQDNCAILYRLNRDVMQNPELIQPGMNLKYPVSWQIS